MFGMNLSEFDTNTPKFFIKAGSYHFQIANVENAISKNGNPQAVITYKVIDGDEKGFSFKEWNLVGKLSPEKENDPKYKGLKQALEISATKLCKLAKAVDLLGENDEKKLIGKVFLGTVKTETKDNKTNNRMIAFDKSELPEMEDDDDAPF